MIDWQQIVEGYNDRYGTQYASVKSIIGNAYRRWGSIKKASKDLGVSYWAFREKMRGLQIECESRGGVPQLPYSPSTDERIRRIHPRTLRCMSLKEIATDIQRSATDTRHHMNKLGLEWKMGSVGWLGK